MGGSSGEPVVAGSTTGFWEPVGGRSRRCEWEERGGEGTMSWFSFVHLDGPDYLVAILFFEVQYSTYCTKRKVLAPSSSKFGSGTGDRLECIFVVVIVFNVVAQALTPLALSAVAQHAGL